MRRRGILLVSCGVIAVLTAAVAWFTRPDGQAAELAEHLRCLAVVGQVVQENQGRWPDDLVAAARRIPEAAAHVDAAEALVGQPCPEFIRYRKPDPAGGASQVVVSAEFHGTRISILANGLVNIAR